VAEFLGQGVPVGDTSVALERVYCHQASSMLQTYGRYLSRGWRYMTMTGNEVLARHLAAEAVHDADGAAATCPLIAAA
jgi:hypothetical protein